MVVLLLLYAIPLSMLVEQLWRDYKRSVAWAEKKRIAALEYECLFPEDPCLPPYTKEIECDNCVRWKPHDGRDGR